MNEFEHEHYHEIVSSLRHIHPRHRPKSSYKSHNKHVLLNRKLAITKRIQKKRLLLKGKIEGNKYSNQNH